MLLIIYFVKLRYINDFTIYEIMSDCMALILKHCPFKPACT